MGFNSGFNGLIFIEPCIVLWLVAITNKMQLSNGIILYLSHFPLRRHHGRSPQAYVNQKLQIHLRFLMMSDITLETCWTINVLWNNKIPLLGCILLVIATSHTTMHGSMNINPLNPELNPICYLLALLGAHHFLHVSRIRVKSLTLRLLMSYIFGAPILDVSRSHTTTQHSR